MTLTLLILFLLVGIAGLIYDVDTGVFVGLGLVPWQIIKLNYNHRISLLAIIITTIVGAVYFIHIQSWTLLALFLVIEIYNLWGYYRQTGQ